MPIKTRPFDAAEYLTDDETIAAYLTEMFSSGDPVEIAIAIGDVARARGLSELVDLFSRDGNPRLDTLLAVTKALGYEFKIVPQHKEGEPESAE